DPVPATTTEPGCDLRPPPLPPPPPGGGSGVVTQPPITAPPLPGASGVVDRTPPVIGRVGMARTRFAVGRGPTAITAAGRGTAFRFTLSKAGVMRIRIRHVRRGRRVGGRCLAATRPRAHRRL